MAENPDRLTYRWRRDRRWFARADRLVVLPEEPVPGGGRHWPVVVECIPSVRFYARKVAS